MTIWPTNPGSRAKLTTGQRKLGEVAEIYQGGKSGLTKKDYVKSGFLAFSATGQDGFTKKAFDSGFAVILSSIGARCGKCFYAEGKWTALANTQVIKLDDPMAAKFLYYYLNDENKWPRYGSAQPFIAPSTVKRLKVPFPSLPIQKKIVERLDAIKKTQELNDKQLVLVEELFQSLLHRELDPKGKNWEVKRLGELSLVITKGTTPTTYGYRFTDAGIPFLRVEDVNNDLVNPKKTEYHISKETHEFMKRSKTEPRDILVTIAGTIGRVAHVPENAPEMNMNQAVAIVRLKPLVNHLYVFYLLRTKELQRAMKFAEVTGTITNISLTTLKNLKIPLPPIETQRKIVEKLSAVQEYKKKLVEQREKLKELFESVLHKSMAGKI